MFWISFLPFQSSTVAMAAVLLLLVFPPPYLGPRIDVLNAAFCVANVRFLPCVTTVSNMVLDEAMMITILLARLLLETKP